MTAKADGAEISQRLSKIETAISRRKTIEFTYYTIERDATEKRKVDPYHLVYRGGQFYLIGHSHEREAVRVFRLSRIQGKVSYASKAEHDFTAPEDFDRRDYARARGLAAGRDPGDRQDLPPRPDRLAGRARLRRLRRAAQRGQGRRRPGQGHGLRDRVRLEPPAGRLGAALAPERDGARAPASWPARSPSGWSCCASATRASSRPRGRRAPSPAPMQRVGRGSNGRSESSIRPERFARLVTLAGMLIEAAKGERPAAGRRGARQAPPLRRGAARGHRPAQRRQLRRRHLRALRRADRRRDRGRRRALRRQLRRPGAAAAAGGEGAGRGDRPLRRPPAPERPGQRPRARSSRRSATTPPRRAWRSPLRRRRLGDRPHGQRRDRRPARARDPLLQGERGRVHQARDRALPPRQRPRGLVRRLL